MNLKRDKTQVLEQLKVMSDGSVIVRSQSRVTVPKHWMHVNLGSISEKVHVFGFFPIIIDDVYSVFNANAMIQLTPSKISLIDINDESYYEFIFNEDTTIIKNLNIVKNDKMMFDILNELFMKGKVPWWASVDDMCSIFDTALEYAGSKVANVPQTIETMVAVCAASMEDLSKPLRQYAKDLNDYRIDNIEFNGLNSVLYAVNATTAKLSGAYFHDGVVSAIVNPTQKSSKIEKILRA